MSTYTLSHQEIRHVLLRQAQQIADRAFPHETAAMRDRRASQWIETLTPGLLQSIGLKAKEH